MSADVKDKNVSETDEYSYKPRARSGGAKSSGGSKTPKKFNKKAVIIPLIIIAVLFGAVVALSCSMPKNKAAHNVYVNELNVSGMNEAEIAQAVSELVNSESEYVITSSGKQMSIKAEDIELSVDSEETARRAIQFGKSKNIFSNAYHAVKLMAGKEVIGFVPEYNQEKLDGLLFEFGTTINGVSTGAEYEYGDSSMTIIPGTPGQNQDTSTARNQFLNAVGIGSKENIEVTLDYADPQVLNADEVYNEVCKPAQDAYYDRTEDGGIIVKEDVVGVEIDKNDLENAVKKVNGGERATIPANIVKPAKTKSQLEANLFTTTIGTYSSDFSSSSENRASNVKKAAEAVNGKILMPGDVFSYNGTIGNPSLANGYKVAPVFENGKKSEGVGGGVCQVSSTLYCAVLYADLDVVERHNHSLTVGYVPNGQDATVAYGSLDFRFKNSTDYPVKVNAVVNGRKLTISLLGAKRENDRKIEISNKTVSTIQPTQTETKDASLPAGTRKVTSSGKKGYVVDTYKTVYENGTQKSSNKITRSTYKMVPAEVVVGTKGSTTASSPNVTEEPANSTAPAQAQPSESTAPPPEVSGDDPDTVVETE